MELRRSDKLQSDFTAVVEDLQALELMREFQRKAERAGAAVIQARREERGARKVLDKEQEAGRVPSKAMETRHALAARERAEAHGRMCSWRGRMVVMQEAAKPVGRHWVRLVPTNRIHVLAGSEFTTALARRIGTIPPAAIGLPERRCQCVRAPRLGGNLHHLDECREAIGTHSLLSRHDEIGEAIKHLVREAGGTVHPQPIVVAPRVAGRAVHVIRPDYEYVFGAQRVMVDVTVTAAAGPTYTSSRVITCTQASRALRDAEKRKDEHYDEVVKALGPNCSFYPMAFSIYGGTGVRTQEFIKLLIDRLYGARCAAGSEQAKSQVADYVRKCIGAAVVRACSRMFLGRLKQVWHSRSKSVVDEPIRDVDIDAQGQRVHVQHRRC